MNLTMPEASERTVELDGEKTMTVGDVIFLDGGKGDIVDGRVNWQMEGYFFFEEVNGGITLAKLRWQGYIEDHSGYRFVREGRIFHTDSGRIGSVIEVFKAGGFEIV